MILIVVSALDGAANPIATDRSVVVQAPLNAVVQAAAGLDAEIRALAEDRRAQRLRGMRVLAQALADPCMDRSPYETWTLCVDGVLRVMTLRPVSNDSRPTGTTHSAQASSGSGSGRPAVAASVVSFSSALISIFQR